MDSDRRESEEQIDSQPSVGDRSRIASRPNEGQPPIAEQLIAQMGEVVRRLQPVIPPPVQKSPIELVRKYGAEDFKGQLTDDSPAAKYWLERTERIMEQLHCTDDEKLECAVSLLQESAYQWWTTVKRRVNGDLINWSLFLKEFQDKYIGETYIEAKRREFLQLRQNQLSVFEYEKEFLRLSKYYLTLIATEEERCKRFEQGLNSELQLFLAAQQYTEFPKLVKAAIRVERVIKQEQERNQQKRGSFGEQSEPKRTCDRRPEHRGYLRSESRSQPGTESSVPIVSPRVMTPIRCKHCGWKHEGVCWRLTGACVKCGATDHKRKDCPRLRMSERQTPVMRAPDQQAATTDVPGKLFLFLLFI